MSVKHQFFQHSVERLLPIYDRRESEQIIYSLIEHLTGMERADFWVAGEKAPLPDENEWAKLLQRLLSHEPVQYITGTAHFGDFELQVSPATLIPRPETLELVEWIIEEEKAKSDLKIVDVGTGTGCIPIGLAQQLNAKEITAIDISAEALKVAEANAHKYGFNHIRFQQADILTEELNEKDLDIIVSNPPYVLESDKESMRKNVLEFEPGQALYVPDSDPLRFYKCIATQALRTLRNTGSLYFEIHERFGLPTQELLQQLGFQEVIIKKDFFQGKDRMIKATKP